MCLHGNWGASIQWVSDFQDLLRLHSSLLCTWTGVRVATWSEIAFMALGPCCSSASRNLSCSSCSQYLLRLQAHIHIYTRIYVYTHTWDTIGLSGRIGTVCTHTRWKSTIGCVIVVGNFSQKSPIISGSFAERDLQLKTPYVSSPGFPRIQFKSNSSHPPCPHHHHHHALPRCLYVWIVWESPPHHQQTNKKHHTHKITCEVAPCLTLTWGGHPCHHPFSCLREYWLLPVASPTAKRHNSDVSDWSHGVDLPDSALLIWARNGKGI